MLCHLLKPGRGRDQTPPLSEAKSLLSAKHHSPWGPVRLMFPWQGSEIRQITAVLWVQVVFQHPVVSHFVPLWGFSPSTHLRWILGRYEEPIHAHMAFGSFSWWFFWRLAITGQLRQHGWGCLQPAEVWGIANETNCSASKLSWSPTVWVIKMGTVWVWS